MTVVVGIRFKDSGKTYYFDPRDLELQQGEHVIVETVRGLELARVAFARREVNENEIVGELKPVVRRAENADLERHRLLQDRHDEVLARCAEKIREHDLPMSLVKAEYSFDGSRLTFFFTAEKRVDFRMLVRDLARTFKSRIELRQIGPRDEAKLIGGIGPCGRLLCCATFLPDYARVSIKMAKDQDLPLNPTKISGVCGRLLCCLSYEHEQYLEMRAALPRKGAWVQTPDGPGEVVSQHVLNQQVVVQLASSGMQESYALHQIQAVTEQVIATARARAAEGITPRREAYEPKQRGERQLLRNQIDNYETAEVLSLLEEGDELIADSLDERDDQPRAQTRGSAQPAGNPSSRSGPPSRPANPRRSGPRERPQAQLRTDDRSAPGTQTGSRREMPTTQPSAQQQTSGEASRSRARRRRRSGRGSGPSEGEIKE